MILEIVDEGRAEQQSDEPMAVCCVWMEGWYVW